MGRLLYISVKFLRQFVYLGKISANLTNDKPSGVENLECQTKPSDAAKGMPETERTAELATEPEIPDL